MSVCRKRGQFYGVLALALTLLGGAAQAAPAAVTLDALIGNPNLEAFQNVWVDGQIDDCQLQCRLCPLSMTRANFDPAKCIDLRLDGFAATDPSPNDDAAASRAELLQMRAFRYASVTLEAVNDPGCSSKTRLTDDRGPGDAVCLGPALIHARVISVHSRKIGAEGLVSSHVLGHLVVAPPADSEAMLAEYRAMDPDTKPLQMRAFLAIVDDPALMGNGITAVGYDCVCRIASCEGQWPASIEATDSAANPFMCFDMEKHDGRWLFLTY